ncbi:MAG: hypothetical protein JRJ85_09790, partial [Deltaproteobacteria bacterium]|nr:hypothetical protein [Deltaproteobacteria bacterium]
MLTRMGTNPMTLQGAKGLMTGKVRRFDERDHVFARNRALRPGSEQYRAYYTAHPDREDFDARRRERGGPMGPPGTLDKP